MEIDIRRVLKSKKPALAKLMPGFVIRYLERIVHQQEINTFMHGASDLSPIEFVRAILKYLDISYDTVGMEKLDTNGRYLFASNHPFGGMDGLMLADKVESYFGDVKVIINDLLMNIEPARPLFIPVNKHGRQNNNYANIHNEAFESDVPILTFPAGLCSRRKKGVVSDPKWKPSFVKKAVSFRRDIVPVYCEGELSNFFYRLSSLRTTMGIRVNIEMLYLANEMFKQRGKHFHLFIGDPIPWQELKNDRSFKVTANEIRTKAYNLSPAAKK